MLAAYPTLSDNMQAKTCELLVARRSSASPCCGPSMWGIASNAITVDQLRRAALHDDENINALVRKHWGNIGPGTAEENLRPCGDTATMRGTGDANRGKELFAKHCGTCHQLNGAGNKVGPDLTIANRQDLAALLDNIVDPVRHLSRICQLCRNYHFGSHRVGIDGRPERCRNHISRREQSCHVISRDEIDTLEVLDISLMPERILDELSPQQLRDLFAYLHMGRTDESG